MKLNFVEQVVVSYYRHCSFVCYWGKPNLFLRNMGSQKDFVWQVITSVMVKEWMGNLILGAFPKV